MSISPKWAFGGFNDLHLVGLRFFGLPIEEYLFFFCIPYACTFTYFVLRNYVPKLHLAARQVLFVLAALLLLALLFVHDLWYPKVTFVLLAAFILVVVRRKEPFLQHFLAMYLIILLPFSVVNGILTGSWIKEEVVWYNDAENLGIRLGTIPVEDTMYGMLMLLMTITFMEWLKGRPKPHLGS